MMRESIAEAELESMKDVLLEILWGVNWVQLSLDIVFDIWIAAGCFFLALGALALGVNFATLPHPPAEAGLFDPGTFVASWFGVFLGLVMLRHRRGKR